ncbi:MAG: hypothetical protein PHX30_05160 [Candidatus Pacebacteria bacterium]|nr:hypothetical protein [Candidatus Paceibacterota bacterium]
MKKNTILKDIFGFSAFVSVMFGVYLNFEPAVVGAVTDDITVTQVVTSDITISHPADVNMTGTIYGMTGGTGTGSATWTVKTSDTSGFGLTLSADDDTDCLNNGVNDFKDYVNASPLNYAWVDPAISAFGFTVEPETATDTATAFRDNGSICGTGSGNTADTCWSGFGGTLTTPKAIVNRTSQTDIGGQDEVVKFKTRLISGQFLPEGNYVAVIKATALVNS